MCIISKMGTIRVKIVGRGKVGTAFSWHLSRLKYHVVDSRIPAGAVDVVFITVPDRKIFSVFKKIRNQLKPGALVVHCAGVFGIEVFKGAEKRKLETLALHPVKSFSNVKQAIQDLPEGYFVLDGTLRGLTFGRQLVKQLKGRAIVVRSKDRPLYHAMCVFASNFIHPLFWGVERIAKELGFSEKKSQTIMLPLTMTVLKNIAAKGSINSLTGPVKRGDWLTVKRHLSALKNRVPEVAPLYEDLTEWLKRLKG